ncbi:hypothetical protein PILCRDRAFT_818795 [Piloderma croceum F 1598]|uniref:Uncharacterized protein n=1 Tax=Piloderma croceum (strain F 1598) TaxID=765440 RepID=A0A0C3C2I6_PILCF|nr:hypothetical protein PILCRDRAFT_818795 [Piloderma croceum F 1598]
MDDGFCCLSAITHHSRTIHIFLWAVSVPSDPSIPEMACFELTVKQQLATNL